MDDLKRNGSGYYDPTAYKAIRKIQNGGVSNMNIRKGEIWEVEHGAINKLALVIAYHGSYCSVLILNDEPRESRDIRLNARGMKYTESGMVSYKFCDAFVDFVRTTTDEEFDDVMGKVSESLCLNVQGKTAGDVDKLKEEISFREKLVFELKCMIEERDAKIAYLESSEYSSDSQEVAVLKAQLEIYKQQNEMMLEKLIGA